MITSHHLQLPYNIIFFTHTCLILGPTQTDKTNQATTGIFSQFCPLKCQYHVMTSSHLLSYLLTLKLHHTLTRIHFQFSIYLATGKRR